MILFFGAEFTKQYALFYHHEIKPKTKGESKIVKREE